MSVTPRSTTPAAGSAAGQGADDGLARLRHGDGPRGHWLGHALLAAAAAWLLFPLLTPVHVEGFSASIQSIGMHLAAGELRAFDALFPFNLEFFATSRVGMNLLAAGLYAIAPAAGEWPLRIVMWLGWIGLVGASTVLIRRWADVGPLTALGVLLLMPGMVESAFFYNDNVLSAALAIASVALVAGRRGEPVRWAALLAAGLAFGAAVLVRADAVLLGPAVGLCLLARCGPGRRLVAALAGFGAVAGALIALVPAALGFTFLDTLQAARRAVELWDRGPSLGTHARAVLLFLGPPGLLLGLLGLLAAIGRRPQPPLALLVGIPLLYNIVYLGKVWEVRPMLPLTPFLGALVAIGVAWLLRAAPRMLRACALALLALLLVLPPEPVWLQEGPRSPYGRVWSPLLWSGWQQQVRGDFNRLDALAEGLSDNALVITDNWSFDRYLHLALQKAGYRAVASAPAVDCAGTVETFRRGEVTVRHLRLHTPFLPDWSMLQPALLDRYLAACGPLLAGAIAWYVTSDPHMRHIGLDDAPAFGGPALQVGWLGRLGQHALSVRALDAGALAVLQAAYREEARHAGDRARAVGRGDLDLQRSRQALAPLIGLF